jgi:hypothetical protein
MTHQVNFKYLSMKNYAQLASMQVHAGKKENNNLDVAIQAAT